ncbi:MAG TPA: hypothetical protein EYP36_04755 [Calditrichaeota bacterium]|nr:hypothetical protein [Calditrichota bacterium]
MSNCHLPDLDYSSTHRNNRLSQARDVLGTALVNRIIAFTLFLFGANRKEISKYLQVPHDTLLSFYTRVTKLGLPGFEDRRAKPMQHLGTNGCELNCSIKENQIELHWGCKNKIINIPQNNSLQSKIILLTFLDNGLITRKEAAQALSFSCANTDKLLRKIRTEDVFGLIDKRKGQQQDYVFTPEVKSEVILQFTSNAVLGKSTSGSALANDLKERTQLDLSERSIRMYISKLGLKDMSNKLLSLVEKKTLGNS